MLAAKGRQKVTRTQYGHRYASAHLAHEAQSGAGWSRSRAAFVLHQRVRVGELTRKATIASPLAVSPLRSTGCPGVIDLSVAELWVSQLCPQFVAGRLTASERLRVSHHLTAWLNYCAPRAGAEHYSSAL